MSTPRQTILVVDDDPNIRRVVEINLRINGYDVVTAKNGEECLAAVARYKPALLVLDITMPGMNGLQVAEELQEEPETADIPIVFLTARAQDEDVLAGWEAGADWYMTKPFDPSRLCSVITDILSLKPDARRQRAKRIAEVVKIEMQRKREASRPRRSRSS